MRTPNASCDNPDCNNVFYRRPWELKKRDSVFCSRYCYRIITAKKERECAECGSSFIYKHPSQKYCGKSCAAKVPRSDWKFWDKGAPKNKVEFRAKAMVENGIPHICSVEGCDYSTTLDIHRFIPGREGGEYEFGNMFFLCPNHHAEITRGISKAKRVDGKTLILDSCPSLV